MSAFPNTKVIIKDNNINSKRINNKEKISLLSPIRNTLTSSKKNKKNVSFVRKVDIIDVVSWKKYNYEQTSEKDIKGFLDDLRLKKNQKNPCENIRNKNNKKNQVHCTCFII